jgi:hypothetical protein
MSMKQQCNLANLTALTPRSLNGFTLWHYRAVGTYSALRDIQSPNEGAGHIPGELIGNIAGPGYFDPAADHLNIGDRIMIHADDGSFDAVVREVEPAVRVSLLSGVFVSHTEADAKFTHARFMKGK